MTLIKRIYSSSELYHDLKSMDRNNFSYDGAAALQEYLEEMDSDIEYDPVAFCCDFAEYAEFEYEALAAEYDEAPQRRDYESEEEFAEAFMDWLQDQTTVIEFNGGIIVGSF